MEAEAGLVRLLTATQWKTSRSREARYLACLALGTAPLSAEGVGMDWTESLAVLARLNAGVSSNARVLLDCRGREAHWLWRWKFRIWDTRVKLDPTKFGWGWSNSSSSWVIPTAISIVALEKALDQGVVPTRPTLQRVQLGKEMLLNRVCAGGGWNAGNSEVYGVALRPHLDTTAIALLGLQDGLTDHTAVASAQWMFGSVSKCRSPYSVAWVLLAAATLSAHSNALAARAIPEIETRLRILLAPLPEEPTTAATALLALRAVQGVNPFLVSLRPHV